MKRLVLCLCLLACWSILDSHAYKLRIMSYNIRLYTKADGPKNLWENRRDPLCKYVAKVSPDVLGMQEVVRNQLDDVLQRLPDYDFVGVGRDDGATKGEYSPVLFRKDKYTVVDKGWFWLSETPDQPSYGWTAACRRIATWVILKDNKTGEKFFFCNTHFDHKSVKARKESAKLTKEKFKSIAGNLPVLFCADFNTNEKEETYSLLCNYSYPFNDVWKVAKKRKGGPATFNGWGNRKNTEDEKIDFIFVSPSVKAKKATIYSSALGDGYFMSDHNALWADLEW